jgi:hypothetical protein
MSLTLPDQYKYSHWRPEQVKIIDDQVVRFRDVCVHEFTVGDVEDPDLMAGEPLWKWQQTEAGAWVMSNAVEQPYWMHQHDYNSFGHKYRIMARLSEQNETFWKLKWGGVQEVRK